MSVVRSFYDALNAAAVDRLAALYDASCTVEHVFADDPAVYEGHTDVSRRWAVELEQFSGALPGDRRIDVARIAGIETGWGWVQAEWTRGLRERESGQTSYDTGYSHFWIESGLIRRHRSVVRQRHDRVPTPPRPAAGSASTREYPPLPIVGIGAVIFDENARVVLVRRQHEPLAGQWTLPGGRLEIGESLEAGVAREALEETGLVVDVGPLVEAFDRILLDAEGRVRFHYVLIDYLCRPRGGSLAAGGDVVDVVVADPDRLSEFRLTEMTVTVIGRGRELL